MAQDRFDAYRRRETRLGQRRLSDTIRRLIYRTDESIFEQLDFSDDRQFLHPLLFAFFTDPSPSMELSELIFDLLRREHWPDFARLRADPSGRARSSICTQPPARTPGFGRNRAPATESRTTGKDAIVSRQDRPLFVAGTRIEVTTRLHPLLYRFFDTSGMPMTSDDALQVPADRVSCLLAALALLRVHCPPVWAEVAAFARLIVLYRAPAPNSFAALSAHGALFCNVAEDDDEIALLEDVTHQAAHVLFNAFAHDPARVLAVDPETPMHALCDEPDDHRTVYEALHGLFTYTLICRVLSAVADAAALPERHADEILGRLGFTLSKFAVDVKRLDLPDAYTLTGRRCYEAFAAEHHKFQARYGATTKLFAFDNQSYAFNYARFLERNGGPCSDLEELAS